MKNKGSLYLRSGLTSCWYVDNVAGEILFEQLSTSAARSGKLLGGKYCWADTGMSHREAMGLTNLLLLLPE